MNEKYTWNLEEIYSTSNQVEEAYTLLEKQMGELQTSKGKLATSSVEVLKCLTVLEAVEERIAKLDAYATLKYHQNMGDVECVKLYKRVENLLSLFETTTSYIVPELTQIEEKTLLQFLDENGALKRYERILQKVIKNKKHALSQEASYVVSKYATVFGSFDSIYTMLSDVDFKFGEVENEDGEQVPLTHGTYSTLMSSKKRQVRKEAFEKMYAKYKEYHHTIAENYLAAVKEDTITANLKNYASSLEKAVDAEDATIGVYDRLITTVHDNLSMNHRYMALKKKLLQESDFHIYDIFVNEIESEKTVYSFEKAKEMIQQALLPLGKAYIDDVIYALEHRWLDVYEKEGKYSGGYSMGVYGVHPYILLNYTDEENAVSTTAHELGHAMHSYLSMKNQTYFNAQYTIMVAEVASTVNEILLSEYMIKQEQNQDKKATLINQLLDKIRATLIRQTMFAEFEREIHAQVEMGNTLAADDISNIYYKLNQTYFGEDVICDDDISYEWARIPHFYRPFYVYKYATGISSAISIATKILTGDEAYKEKYLGMLAKGGSKDPLDLLREVDVDLETSKPVEDAFKYFEEKLNLLEKLVLEK